MLILLKRYWWMILLIVLLWGVTFLLYLSGFNDAQRGQFGDMFGAVNALFSGLAFAFVIIALIQQQKQFERQAFETGFFELLKLFRQNVDALQLPRQGAEPLQGKLVLGVLRNDLVEKLRKIPVDGSEQYTRQNLKDAYTSLYKDHESRLGDYFRLLFQLMQYIKDAKHLTLAERRRYGNMVRAGLNSNELFLLFFNGLSDLGKGSVDYICRFQIFDHLNLGSFDSRINPKMHYPPSAFGRASNHDVDAGLGKDLQEDCSDD